MYLAKTSQGSRVYWFLFSWFPLRSSCSAKWRWRSKTWKEKESLLNSLYLLLRVGWDGIFFASLDKIVSWRNWAGVEGLWNLTIFHPLNIDIIGICRPVLMSRAEPPTLWHSPSSPKYSEYWKCWWNLFSHDCFKTGNKSAPKSDSIFWWPLTWLPVLMRREPAATLRHCRSSEKLPPSSRIARWHVNFATWDIFAFAMRPRSLSTCCATQEGWHFSQKHGG